eukprot:1161797-Pelagomonas_calceolata.AAC.4
MIEILCRPEGHTVAGKGAIRGTSFLQLSCPRRQVGLQLCQLLLGDAIKLLVPDFLQSDRLGMYTQASKLYKVNKKCITLRMTACSHGKAKASNAGKEAIIVCYCLANVYINAHAEYDKELIENKQRDMSVMWLQKTFDQAFKMKTH